MKILKLQLALFFAEFESRPDRMIETINKSMANLFNEMPTILPAPPDMLPEIPIITLRNKENLYSCNISKSRIDFFQNSAVNKDVNENLFNDFFYKINLFSNCIFQLKKIVRFGLIGQYFLDESKPTIRILKKYINHDLGDLEELNIRFNKRFNSNKFQLNNILDIGSSMSILNGREQKGVFLQRDINNIPTNEFISNKQLSKFIEEHKHLFSNDKVKEVV